MGKMLVISIFGKNRLNFHYRKMTEKMYDKLLEKYSVFQILNSCLTILILIRQLGKKYTCLCNYLKIKS